MRWSLLILLATVSFAEPMRNSESEAIRNSDLIAVGDLSSGHKDLQNGVLDCHAHVQWVRILKGREPAGREVEVHWQYEPRRDEQGDLRADMSPVHGIWFLQRLAKSSEYEAMWVNRSQIPMGGYFLPLPDSSASSFSGAAEANYQEKLAHELADAMVAIAANGTARWDVPNRVIGSRSDGSRIGRKWFPSRPNVVSQSPEGDLAQSEFNGIASVFSSLDAERIESVGAYLMKQGDIHLAAVGLLSELQAKKVDALFEMEKLYPRLNVTSTAFALASAAGQIDIKGNVEAINAVGRMCVSDVRVFPFTGGAVIQLAQTRSRIALPYLQTLLLDQEVNVAKEASQGICAQFGSDVDLRALADSQLIGACNFATVAANRIGNHGPGFGRPEADTTSLRTWLDVHADDVQKVTGMSAPSAPAWFFAP